MAREALIVGFWVCVAILLYHHVVYPWLLGGLARSRREADAKVAPETVNDADLPRLTVIVPAFNEESFIERKIENLAASLYPRDKLRVVIAIDGSADATPKLAVAAAERYAAHIDCELVHYHENIGKIAVLNDQIARVSEGVVALSDTSAILEADGLRRAARHFQSDLIAFVVGRYQLANAGSEGERAYMELLSRVRADEAVLHSPVGAHGAFYMVRRDLWTPLPPETINDDFVLPMRMLGAGRRAIYDSTIRVLELETTQRSQEFKRRVRIGAGNLQQSLWLWSLAMPRNGWLAFLFISGKGSRPFMPAVAIFAWLICVRLAVDGMGLYAAISVLVFVAILVGLGTLYRRSPNPPRAVAWLGYMINGYAASLLGAAGYLAGRSGIAWVDRKTPVDLPPVVRWQSPTAIASRSARV